MKILFSIVVAMFLIPGAVGASSVVRSADTVSIASDQVVEGDFYGFGNTIAISGKVNEDLLLLGGTATMNGTVGADLAALVGSLDFHGTASDDVRIVAGKVTIAGEVGGNLVVVANELEILSTARIGGDVLFFGSKAEINGYVGKDILGAGEDFRIDGEVAGRIDIDTTSLTLGDRAKIGGDITYTSLNELTRAQNAQVTGVVIRADSLTVDSDPLEVFLLPLLISLFAALVWYLLFKQFVVRVVEGVMSHPLRNLLIGFGTIFLLPISAVILVISTLGSILGVTLLFAYLLLVFVSVTLVGVLIGSYLAKTFAPAKTASVLFILLGVCLAHVLLYVPIVGPLVLVGLLLLTIGSVAERIYTLLRFA